MFHLLRKISFLYIWSQLLLMQWCKLCWYPCEDFRKLLSSISCLSSVNSLTIFCTHIFFFFNYHWIGWNAVLADAAVANFQVKKEQIHRDAEPKPMFLDTMKPMEICSRQQIVRSWCTCWGLTQMLVGVGFILFPYVRKSELNDFARNRLSASSPEYLQWVLQSRSRWWWQTDLPVPILTLRTLYRVL